MTQLKNIAALIFVFGVIIRFGDACNGYSLKILKAKNCLDDSVIKLPEKDFGVTLDNDCNLYGYGCLEITKGFKSAKTTYHVKKPPLPQMDGDIELCDMTDLLKKSPDIAKTLEVMGVPTKCPVEAKKVCGSEDKKISLGKYKNQIGMGAGKTDVKLEIEHDTGKSCIELTVSLSKVRKG
ncbi:uncharacterized protein LOC126738745 [Anthonomus grandis grandis]|uniref:uncharacterized protein LOC126738745 n=1 Tax=Anthonomus grandis grandis TaxID=2921223 RepID=UPI0021661F77|nr:uncharacterized protein LOC126738745 [Anthonomus grandis grandis]